MKKKRKKIKYSKNEEKFYKKNKKKIIEGLSNIGVPKNQIKKIFFGSVKEEIEVNNLGQISAMKKVLRSRTFTSIEENQKLYKEEVINKTIKGKKRNIKKYLGISGKEKLDVTQFTYDNEGLILIRNGKTILLKRNPDTKVEGWDIAYV